MLVIDETGCWIYENSLYSPNNFSLILVLIFKKSLKNIMINEKARNLNGHTLWFHLYYIVELRQHQSMVKERIRVVAASWEKKCRLTFSSREFSALDMGQDDMWSFLKTHWIMHLKSVHLMISRIYFIFKRKVSSYWEAIMRYSKPISILPFCFWFSCRPSAMRMGALCSFLPCEIFVQKPLRKYKGSLWLCSMTHCQVNF